VPPLDDFPLPHLRLLRLASSEFRLCVGRMAWHAAQSSMRVGNGGRVFFSLSIADDKLEALRKAGLQIRAGRGDRRNVLCCLNVMMGQSGGFAPGPPVQKGPNCKGTRSPRKLLLVCAVHCASRQTDPKFGKQKNSSNTGLHPFLRLRLDRMNFTYSFLAALERQCFPHGIWAPFLQLYGWIA
jgi:hypothetical protein